MSELNINVTQAQGNVPVTVMHLNGHLHGETEGLLLGRARQAVQDGSKHILLDLSGVDVLTSAGLRAIHSIFNLLTPQGDVEVIRQHRDEPFFLDLAYGALQAKPQGFLKAVVNP